MRISDWSSDVCSSDLVIADRYPFIVGQQRVVGTKLLAYRCGMMQRNIEVGVVADVGGQAHLDVGYITQHRFDNALQRSEEHTSELQSLMRISYAVFCLKKKKKRQSTTNLD